MKHLVTVGVAVMIGAGCVGPKMDETAKRRLIEERLQYFAQVAADAETVADIVTEPRNRWTAQKGALVWQGKDQRYEDARYQLFISFPTDSRVLDGIATANPANLDIQTRVTTSVRDGRDTGIAQKPLPVSHSAETGLGRVPRAELTETTIETAAELPIPEGVDRMALRYQVDLRTGKIKFAANTYKAGDVPTHDVKKQLQQLEIPWHHVYLFPDPDSESSTALTEEFAADMRAYSASFFKRKLPGDLRHVAIGASLYQVQNLEDYSEQKSAFIALAVVLQDRQSILSIFYSQLSPHNLRDGYVGLRNIGRVIGQLASEPSPEDKRIRTMLGWLGDDRMQELIEPFKEESRRLEKAFLRLRKIAWDLDPVEVAEWLEDDYEDIGKKRAEGAFLPCFSARKHRNLYFSLIKGNEVGVVQPVRLGQKTYLLIGTKNEVQPIVKIMEADSAAERTTAFEYVPPDQIDDCTLPLVHYNSCIYPDFGGLITAVREVETGSWPRLGYDGAMDNRDTRMGTSMVWKGLKGIRNYVVDLIPQ